jgi:hypothetical protein
MPDCGEAWRLGLWDARPMSASDDEARMIELENRPDRAMCEHWWDERLLREQAERLKRQPVKPEAKPQSQETRSEKRIADNRKKASPKY